ncbi:MAG: glycoside hydrolase [Acidobacteria bacterium]|nr:MAG: glycoside hydrolase [Acidobacteriota bacterium]
MRWREIGPTRAGRARAVAGDPVHSNITYIGFDNGGVWESTDYGSNWFPIFDGEATGSIGAIAVAPSDPSVIYVGTGAGIIRPDLSTGGGVYKSTDGGKTWTRLGLDDTEMIANIAVDPHDPNRVFVAALGHPYGPNAMRGIFRSTDGGKTWKKVLYVDEYTSANDVRINPENPNVVYAALWQQQEGFAEDMSFSGGSGGIYKSTDGGSTWHKLTKGLPEVLEANLAIAPSQPNTVYAAVAAVRKRNGPGGFFGGAPVHFYKTTDGGATWTEASTDPRPMVRIGGGDVPTLAVDPKNSNVIYDCSTVFWRSEDGGKTWSAVRGSPGGDDYQKVFVSPANDNVIDLVSDQGGVISANRGQSWSNWYTQPTAAMYHVTADDAFPYRLCGGQQDSGSACVESRSMDGRITFHNWHPVMIQEYGEAAPDPKNPNLVYGAAHTSVSLYNRATGQSASVGPDIARGSQYGRSVRTMPIIWSPANDNMLLFATNAVWKTLNGGHSWTRISGDLTRGADWAVPANAGKYAAEVKPSALGTITALGPSPLSDKVIWAGSSDGLIQVTFDGGAHWKNVTPPGIKPWTRIFNIDAGHFSTQTAYVAANTLRLDDMNPHFWKTHDGGKTWTEIDNGIAPGAVANSIRQDTKVKNLLYAATETQVWVSFDDGGQWQSLQQNMPAISVRDIAVKNDASCLCDDLVAGTHGRGFWVLDDVTPLQQHAQAEAAATAYLFKPETGIRIRFATNDPTPWPPELPAGHNPPPGPILDYYLAQNVSGPVTIQVLKGDQVIRTYTSADNPTGPNPDQDPVAYNELCQKNPALAHCDMTMYWPASPRTIATSAGEHRIWWDMHYQSIAGVQAFGGDGGEGAVPHQTNSSVATPLAPPGNYTVKLTVEGHSYTQPFAFQMDPRVKTPAAGLDQLYRLSAEMYDGAKADRAAYEEARAALAKTNDAALKKQIAALAPPPPPPGRGRFAFFFRRGPMGPPTLASIANAEMNAAMAMQHSDMMPTAAEIAACQQAHAQAETVLEQWTALKAKLGQ